jgi:hypothetical protein
MNPWNKAKLSIEFETESVHGKTMHLCILYNNQIVQKSRAMSEGVSTWCHEIELPTTITLITSGRGPASTIVDSNNNIVKNMSIKIKNIFLDGLPTWDNWYEEAIITECDDSDEILIGSTICANATVALEFKEHNVFKWIVKTKS